MAHSTTECKELPDGYAFYKSIGSPKFICAPMVHQSELPFRLLCHSYSVDLCFSPMINSKHYLDHPKYAACVFQTSHGDRPLIAQFCGHDPAQVLQAAQSIQHRVDAIDLNFGCPQNIAKKGRYGAFLLSDVDLMCRLVRTLHRHLSVPVTAKIRVLADADATLAMCLRLRASGLSLLTVHGRTIAAKKQDTALCDWRLIRRIKRALDIPVFANGGCETRQDVLRCLQATQCDGYMAAESLLANPAMFLDESAPRCHGRTLSHLVTLGTCSYS